MRWAARDSRPLSWTTTVGRRACCIVGGGAASAASALHFRSSETSRAIERSIIHVWDPLVCRPPLPAIYPPARRSVSPQAPGLSAALPEQLPISGRGDTGRRACTATPPYCERATHVRCGTVLTLVVVCVSMCGGVLGSRTARCCTWGQAGGVHLGACTWACHRGRRSAALGKAADTGRHTLSRCPLQQHPADSTTQCASRHTHLI